MIRTASAICERPDSQSSRTTVSITLESGWWATSSAPFQRIDSSKERKTDLARRNKAGSSCSGPPLRALNCAPSAPAQNKNSTSSHWLSGPNSTYVARAPNGIYRKDVTPTFGSLAGLLVGLGVCLIPAFQAYSTMVMADILTGTFMLWAAYWWSRYLENGRLSTSVVFGVLAGLALLTKANAGALALMPLPATVLAGRSDLLRRRSFWIPPGIVAVLAGPWLIFYASLMAHVTRVPTTPSIAYRYLLHSFGIFGVLTIPFVLAGMGGLLFGKGGAPGGRPLWAVSVSMLLGFILYHCLVPGGFESRYVLMIAPWVAVLLISGAALSGLWLPVFIHSGFPVVLLASVVAYGAATIRIPAKTQLPYSQVAADLVGRTNLPQSVFLFSSESAVETAFVAEVAMRDKRPNHFVLRGSKMLARMNWNGNRYENRAGDETQVRERLGAWGVSRVIIDTTPGATPWPHHRLLRKAVSEAPEWRLTRRYGSSVEVYEFLGTAKLPDRIEVDVPYTLRRSLTAPVMRRP